MSYQEKKHIVSLFSSILIFGSYCFYVYLRYHDAVMEGTELFRFWGAVILILIPVTIVAKIIIEIIFVIINRIATNEAAPAFADELDKQIELRAMRFSYLVFVLVFACDGLIGAGDENIRNVHHFDSLGVSVRGSRHRIAALSLSKRSLRWSKVTLLATSAAYDSIMAK